MDVKTVSLIGGGTGSYTVLKGFKNHIPNLYSIVSVFDSGGSTGILKNAFGHIAHGDVRRCLLALAGDNTQNLQELLNYRFPEKPGVSPHSLGNLMLAAAFETHSEKQGLDILHEILNVKGKVCPVTYDKAELKAVKKDGTVVIGETHIDIPTGKVVPIDFISLTNHVTANPDAIQAILESDVVLIGPGDLYTSVLPNLLVDGIPQALQKSDAKKIYVCNLMTKYGETQSFKASDFVREVLRYAGPIDEVLINISEPSQEALIRYENQNAEPVSIDDTLFDLGLDIKTGDFLHNSKYIRHDPEKILEVLVSKCRQSY